jgi:hypothetical protein
MYRNVNRQQSWQSSDRSTKRDEYFLAFTKQGPGQLGKPRVAQDQQLDSQGSFCIL